MLLSEEQMLVRDMARRFAREKLAPNSAAWDRDSTFPAEAVTKMGQLGLLGMLVPEEWGGAGTDMISYAVALEEVAAGDGACSTIMAVHNSVACVPILTFGTTAQKERFLRPLAEGRVLGAFCLTEPQAGSDAANLKTRAVRDGDQWVLNGTKQFITNGANAGVAIVFAVTDASAGKKGITAFLVPTDTPGYSCARLEDKMGQRASDTAQVVLEDLRLGDELVLGEPGQGYRIALSNLEGGRIGIAAQAVGMARAALDEAVRYARERESFGKPIIEHQAVAFRLAEMSTQVAGARQLVLHAAALRDAGRSCVTEAAMAKLAAGDMAETVASEAIQIHGGYGYLRDYAVERIYRDVRVCRIYEGTSDIQKLIIARALAAGEDTC